jgi:hypothetical protein
MSSTVVLQGKVITSNWCESEIEVSKASTKLLMQYQGKFTSPIKKGLLKLKPSKFTHGRQLLVPNAEVDITVRLSYYRYSSDPQFKNVTNQGMSVQAIMIELRKTKR